MRKLAAFAFALCLGAPSAHAADPLSDAPEEHQRSAREVTDFPSYAQAVQAWRTPEDLNAWIAAKADYDIERSMLLSETQRAVAPELKARYVMIEFDPVAIRGNTLRRHWVAAFERDGKRYFFADSKRPGHIAGPYALTQAYLDDYAKYRGREIVAFRELDSYARRMKTPAGATRRESGG